MTTPDDDAVARFRRRTRGTDDATLLRNLEAGVYGPVGSRRRAVAEYALQQRFSEVAAAVQSASGDRPHEMARELERARRRAAWALVVGLAALVLAFLSFGRIFGFF